jgi:hypothetical protein
MMLPIELYRQLNGLRDWREIHRRLKDGGFSVPASPCSLRRQFLRWKKTCPQAANDSRIVLDFLVKHGDRIFGERRA